MSRTTRACPTSAGPSTGCRWRSSRRRPVCAPSPRTNSPTASPTVSAPDATTGATTGSPTDATPVSTTDATPRLDERLGAHEDGRFRLLSRGDRSKARRHRTLRAVVEWSWDLLEDEERELAAQLTVFPGGATLDAVEAVCGLSYPEDPLASLVEKSFLEVSEGRYRTLETIRAFAAEHLTDEGALRDAHAAHFLRLAERAEPSLRGGGQLPWLARPAAEHTDLDAALTRLTRTAPGDALRLMAALTWFRRLRGLHGEQVQRARALLAAVGDEPPEGLAEEYALCLMNAITGRGEDPGEPGLIARAATIMGTPDRPLRLPFTVVLWSLVGGPQLTVDRHVRVQVGDEPWGLPLLDLRLAYQDMFSGRAAESEAAFSRSLARFRATGDRWGMANCLDPLGLFADRGAYDRAPELLDEGLAYVRELEAPEDTADLLRSRATVLLHRGDTEEAAAHFTGFDLPNELGLDRTGLLRSEPGRAVSISNDDDPDRAGALLVFRSERLSYDRRDVAAQKRIITERFAGMGWKAPDVLKALTDTENLYFDAIAQIHLDRVAKGRVVLLGDAGHGATMGGMGTGTALVCAHVLAGELALAGGDHRTAFAEYESRTRDFTRNCQQRSANAGPFFAPPTERSIRNRDRMYRLLSSRLLEGFFKKLADKEAAGITLRDYPARDATTRPET
jgi:hypothetical protein